MDYPPPLSVAAPRVPGLMRIPFLLLLALLAMVPALAQAQATMPWTQPLPSEWSTRFNQAPVGTINLFDVHRNTNEVGTGLKLSHSASDCASGGMMYRFYSRSNSSAIRNRFVFKINGNDGNTSLHTITNSATQYLTLNVRANQVFTGEVTADLFVSVATTCSGVGGTLSRFADIPITLLARRDIRTAESLMAWRRFRTDRLLANANAVTTGIVLHRGTARCPTNMKLLDNTDRLRLQLLNPTNNNLSGSLLTAHTGVTMGGSNARALALLFKARASVPAGTLVAKVEVESDTTNQNCPAAFASTITVSITALLSLAWTTGSNDVTVASAVFATPLSAAATTGVKIHRYAGTCATMRVMLPDNRVTGRFNEQARVRDIIRLSGRNGSTNAALSGVSGFDVTVNNVISGNNYARLEINGSPPSGTMTITAVVSTDCAAVEGLADPLTMSYVLTVTASPSTWNAGPNSSAAATMTLETPASAAPTGIWIHQYAGTCATTRVVLPNNRVTGAGNVQAQIRDILQLRGRDGSTNRALPGSPGFDVRVGNVINGRNYAELEINGSPPVGEYAVTVEVSAVCNSSAADATPPRTLSYMLTVLEEDGYEIESRHSESASGLFVASELAAASAPTATGIRVHRRVMNCQLVDVSMNSSAGSWLGLLRMRVNGGATTAVDGVVGRYFPNVRMHDTSVQDSHFRLVFSAGAQVGARSRVELVTVVVSPASQCPAASRPELLALTSKYAVTIRAGYRDVGSNETLQAATTLWTSALRASATAVTTGIKFQRGLTACPDTSMRLLNHTGYLRLQPVNASGVLSGSAATSHANVPMFRSSAAENRALALLFAPRAQAPAGTLTVEVLASTDTTRSGCAQALPHTIRAFVTLVDPTAWQAGVNASSQAASVILAAEIGSDPVDTGIRFSHSTATCDRARLVLTDSTVAGKSVSVSARTIARFQRYTASNTKDGDAGHDLMLTNVSSGVYAALEVMGTPPLGTLTFEAVATPTCSPAPAGVEPLTLSYQVTVQDQREAGQAVSSATGAAVTRMIGMRGLDAVLVRVAGEASTGRTLLEALAAKEQELESGDIDLRTFLAGQSFALGLDASASGRPGFGAWGRAEFLQLEDGEDSDPLQHEGDMFSAQVGADYRLPGGALLGVGYGRHQLDTDYTGRTASNRNYAGTYALELDVAQPYAALPLASGHLAGAVAVGSGKAELTGGEAYDVDYQGWALGYRHTMGDGGLDVEGALSGGSLDIPDLGASGIKSDNRSLRAGLRYAPVIVMDDGSLRPSAGLAIAVDWGDDSGHKYELSTGLGYIGHRFAVSAEYLYIGLGDSAFNASGGSLDVRFHTAPGNLGLSLAATPARGATAGSDPLPDADAGMRGSAEVGYGLAVDGGVLTPYGGWSFATEAGELGLKLRQGDGGQWLLRWREAERDMTAIEFSLLGD